MWPQPITPVHSLSVSASIAAIPLAIVLLIMGVLRKSALLASVYGLISALLLALLVWGMPVKLAFWSMGFGSAYATTTIMWIVFNGLWLYNLLTDTGKFDLLRRWMEKHASDDPATQVVLVAFCFGALIEGSAGFGAPVAITACLLVQLGIDSRRAIVAALIANTAPVAFGGVGIPIVALAGVTGLDIAKLSSMVGRQLPFVSLLLPAYLVVVVAGVPGLRRSWPVALVAGSSFGLVQFLASNAWGPYVTDILSSLGSMFCTVVWLRVRNSRKHPIGAGESAPASHLSRLEAFSAWLPWALLSIVMIVWSHLQLFHVGEIKLSVPGLHNAVLITLYGKPYGAIYSFQPLAVGTAVLTVTVLAALLFRASPATVLTSGRKTARQLLKPGLTVIAIITLAYLYNYSGMAYTVGAGMAGAGALFPFVSSYVGWLGCFLSGSDTSANLLFGNLQVAAAHQLNLNPVLLAATNSSGAVAGKMISPQNIAVGVTTVGLIGSEGEILHTLFRHSIFIAAIIGCIACIQAYLLPTMVP